MTDNDDQAGPVVIPQPRDLAAEMVSLPGGGWVSPEQLLADTIGVDLACPRVLTVQQPYADFITCTETMRSKFGQLNDALGHLLPKGIENRTWHTYWRGVIFIHAGVKKDMEEIRFWGLDPAMFVTRAIVGTVQLSGIVDDEDRQWARPGNKHWVLTNPQRLTRQIPHLRGGQGLLTPTEDLVIQIRDQLVEQVLAR